MDQLRKQLHTQHKPFSYYTIPIINNYYLGLYRLILNLYQIVVMELYSGTDVVKFTDTAFYGPVIGPEDPTTNSPDPTTNSPDPTTNSPDPTSGPSRPTTQTTNPTSENPNTTSKNSAVTTTISSRFILLMFVVKCFFKC